MALVSPAYPGHQLPFAAGHAGSSILRQSLRQGNSATRKSTGQQFPVTAGVVSISALSGSILLRSMRQTGRKRWTRSEVKVVRADGASAAASEGLNKLGAIDASGTANSIDITFSTNFKNMPSKTGVLLLNIGTPATTSVDDVRNYLARFLGDDRVIDIQPSFLKFLVLQLLLGTRPQKSAENYKRIWDSKRGSPLRFHTEDLAEGVQKQLGSDFVVRIGFQYSAPFTSDALEELVKERVTQVIVVPMFPHYASGTSGTSLAEVYKQAAQMFCVPSISAVPPFYDNTLFLNAQAQIIQEAVGPRGQGVDHIIFSFHGLPVKQCTSAHRDGSVCDATCACRFNEGNRNCYRAQCHETARLLTYQLGLDKQKCSVSFQSRLTLRGTIEWIRPYTDDAFETLAKLGVKRLAVVAPSFTADCIETLEELGITGEKQFRDAGGEELILIPCVNASKAWISGLTQMIRDQVPRPTRTVG
mmetsp:Transcript_32016/g.63067  ORF Transcript_32016/g.63067 Transcript_32016/m.63067 type:complete len:473 (+) Transcript_32016:49-1467(+)